LSHQAGVTDISLSRNIDDKSFPTIICNRRPCGNAAPCGAGRWWRRRFVPNQRRLV